MTVDTPIRMEHPTGDHSQPKQGIKLEGSGRERGGSENTGWGFNPPPLFLDPLNHREMGWFSVLSIVCFVAP